MKPEIAAAVLNELRDIRYSVYKDAESFDEGVAKLEYVGQILSGGLGVGLGSYEGEILGLAAQAPSSPDAKRLRELFHKVKEARNDSVHSGAFIRHHSLSLVSLSLLLEEAITNDSKIASDLMVSNPITAELWHNLAMVRRNMLTHSFSYIPLLVGENWKLISDLNVIKCLNQESVGKRKGLLGKTIEELVRNGDLALEEAPTASDQASISDLKQNITHLPILIVDQQDHLLGIISAFDLL
jgi:predicted transcriptional regulator